MSLTDDFLRAFRRAYAESEKVEECYRINSKGKKVGDERWTEAMGEVLNRVADELGYDIKRERGRVDFRLYKTDQSIAVEHENDCKGIFREELPKLLDTQADLRVLITYVSANEFSKNNGENLAERVEKTVVEQISRHGDAEVLLLLNRYGGRAWAKDPRSEPWICYRWRRQLVRQKLLVI
ncbi:MAG: hypothetical protein ABSE39_10230 [Candidatus Bathyarchaeia archaeon]